jgi:hypothetical protein
MQVFGYTAVVMRTPVPILSCLLAVTACTKGGDSPPADSSGRDDTAQEHPSSDTGDGPDPDVPCGEGEPSITLGTGAELFEPLTAGDPVTMVHGPQGGWHILGSLSARHTHPVVDISYTIDSLTHGERVSMNQDRVLLRESEDCTGTFVGMYGYLLGLPGEDSENPDDLDIPNLLGGLPLQLNMMVTDLNGVELTAHIEVLAALDPADMAGDTGE